MTRERLQTRRSAKARSGRLPFARGRAKLPKLFISYRRDDSGPYAGRLYDWLLQQFGAAQLFLDTEYIRAGETFPVVLQERIAASDVVLVVMGPQWLTIENEAGRRLDQEDDSVRLELEWALEHQKRIIPVLVGGAAVPSASDLPLVLRSLAERHAVQLADASFPRDFDGLVDEVLGRPRHFARRELDRLRRLVFVLKSSVVLSPVLVLAFLLAGWLSLFDSLGLDTRMTTLLAGAYPLPEHEDGVLLAFIDERSERLLGRTYTSSTIADWRSDHARLLEVASAEGARAVAFDLFFEAEHPAVDRVLAAAAKQARRRGTEVVFGVRRIVDGEPKLIRPLREAGRWGSLCLIRRLGRAFFSPLLVLGPTLGGGTKSGRHPSLALAAASSGETYEVDVQDRALRALGPGGSQRFRFSSMERLRSGQGPCRALQRGDEAALLLVRPSPPGYWTDLKRSLPYAKLLDASTPLELDLSGRILLVGVRSPNDAQEVVEGFRRRKVPGIELQADALASLVEGNVMTFANTDVRARLLGLMAALGTALSLVTSTMSRWRRRFVVVSAVFAYLGLAMGLATFFNLLTAPLYDVGMLLVTYTVMSRLAGRSSRRLRPEGIR